MLVVVVALLITSPAHAIFDALSSKMDDMIDASILADSLNELSQEIQPDSQVSQTTEKVNKKSEELLKTVREARDIDQDIEDVGDFNLDQKSFESNVRHTTHFVRRVKRLMVTLGVRPKAAAAYGSFETALALNQMIKNQNEVIALMQTRYLEEENRRIKDQIRTNRFIKGQIKEISKRRI